MKSEKELMDISSALLDWAETQEISETDLAYVCAVVTGTVGAVMCKNINDLPTACIALSRVLFDAADQVAKCGKKAKR